MLCCALLASATSCSKPPTPNYPYLETTGFKATDHWETVSARRYAFIERCAVGQQTVELPARSDEFGRRVIVLVDGRQLTWRAEVRAGGTAEALQQTASDSTHARCRLGIVQPGTLTRPGVSTTTRTTQPTRTPPSGTNERGQPDKGGSAPVTVLRRVVGPVATTGGAGIAVGWLPQGKPFFDHGYPTRFYSHTNAGRGPIRIDLSFPRPIDTDGVVIHLLDQRLTPHIPLARYRSQFARRVAALQAHRRKHHAEWYDHLALQQRSRRLRAEKLCATAPVADRSACIAAGSPEALSRRRLARSPRPRETRPAKPGPGVYWVPGEWFWSEHAHAWAWVPGTYVSEAPASPREPTPPQTPPKQPMARSVDNSVPARPAPRNESIPPPPSARGVIWIAGYWELRANRWHWVPGRWRTPPGAARRFRAPVLILRNNVRIYLEPGWLR